MFDIIIKDGKKESYIKLNGNKLEGFNATNGVTTPLTIEEVNTINLLKLSDDKSYLGSVNDYDIYVDNISGLKHYFKDGKEDFEATWEHNGEDALIYKGGKLDKIKDEVKKIPLKNKIILVSRITWLIVSVSFLIFQVNSLYENKKAYNITEALSDYSLDSNVDNLEKVVKKYYEYPSNVTLEQIENLIEENDKITEEEKELVSNTKLLEDIIPYYENTNMNVLIPLKFDELQVVYYYKEPDRESEQENNDNDYESVESAHYNELTPNILYINTYFGTENRYDDKAHEYIHLLQIAHEYRYIKEASAEIISCEYDDKCVNESYLNPVKNTKVLMEIIGPEPICKLNFSGDDTDLVNIIKANLDEEQADKLISLLKEKPGKKQRKGLDEDITSLLSQMYINMYGEDMESNLFIKDILYGDEIYFDGINSRYYFNSDRISKEAPYTEYKVAHHYYAYAVSNNYIDIGPTDILSEESKELFMLSKNEIEINSLKDLTEEMIKENGIIFYYQGEQIDLNKINISKYDNVAITYHSGVYPDSQMEIHKRYLPTIYESFPEQRIGGNSFTK